MEYAKQRLDTYENARKDEFALNEDNYSPLPSTPKRKVNIFDVDPVKMFSRQTEVSDPTRKPSGATTASQNDYS